MSGETLSVIGLLYFVVGFLTFVHCFNSFGEVHAEDPVAHLFGTLMVACTAVGAGVLWFAYWIVWLIILKAEHDDPS